MYRSILNEQETEHAIKLIKDTFQINLATALHLRRVTAPLFVKSGLGLNDNLSGTEHPVSFVIKSTGECAEIVHSLAKWKRVKLGEMQAQPGYGLYTDMNAIRAEETLDELHSLYVDQWDWCCVIRPEERTMKTLQRFVKLIYQAIKNTEYIVSEHYAEIHPILPDDITLFSSEELLQRYPNLSSKDRENKICQEYGAVFITSIGGKLSNGERHDLRAPDYDDWRLNGDILVWYEPLGCVVELSSMGIRVNADSLHSQLMIEGHLDWEKRMYQQMVLNNQLPSTIGGGIGQSRLCMILLHKLHIGEIQVSIWPDEMIEDCQNRGINLLR
ncbi:MAG: aspartate--ammonia ligase [Prevotellaceae bacterium]|nr:aspartate--ammonia ligase [Candidatus Colivivens equi]